MQHNRLSELHSIKKWVAKGKKDCNSNSLSNRRIQKLFYIKKFPFLKEVKKLYMQSEIFLWKTLTFLTSHVNLFPSRQIVNFILEQCIITLGLQQRVFFRTLCMIVCICVQWLSTSIYNFKIIAFRWQEWWN